MNAEPVMKPYVIGLDLGGTNSVFGIVDSRGDIKATTAIKTQGYNNVDDYVKASVDALKIIIDQVGGIDKIKAMVTIITEQLSSHRILNGDTTESFRWRICSQRLSAYLWLLPMTPTQPQSER